MQARGGDEFCWQCHLALGSKPPVTPVTPVKPGKPGKRGKRSREECAADATEPMPMPMPTRVLWRVMDDDAWLRLYDIWQCYLTHAPLRELLDTHHARLLREYDLRAPSLETIGVSLHLAEQADPAHTPLSLEDLSSLINGLDPKYVEPGLNPTLPPKPQGRKRAKMDLGASVVAVTGLDGTRRAFGADATATYYASNVRPADPKERDHALLVSGHTLARAHGTAGQPAHADWGLQ